MLTQTFEGEDIIENSDFIITYNKKEYFVDPIFFEESPIISESLKNENKCEIQGDYKEDSVHDFIYSFKDPKNPILSPDNYFDFLELSIKYRCSKIAQAVVCVLYNADKFKDYTAPLALKAMTYQYKKYFEANKVGTCIASFMKETDISENKVINNQELGKLGVEFVCGLIKEADIKDKERILKIYEQVYRYYREKADVLVRSIDAKDEIDAIKNRVKNEPQSDEKYLEYQIGEQKYQLNALCQYYRIKPTKALEVTRSQNPPPDFIDDIFEAIKQQNVNSVVYLLWKNPNIVLKKKGGLQPLHMAAYMGTSEMVMYCVAKNAPLNGKTDKPISKFSEHSGLTALHIAAIRGDFEITKMLLEDGSDFEERDSSGSTPLINIASIKGVDLETAKLLIDHGSDVNAENNEGVTALMGAVSANNVELVKILIDHKANVNKINNKGESIISIACCKVKNEELIEILFNAGAKTDIDGAEPLIISLYKDTAEINKNIANMVISHTEDINVLGIDYTSAIIEVVKNHQLEELKLFINLCEANNKGTPDMNIEDGKERNPLHYAVIKKRAQTTKFLIENKVEIKKDFKSMSPLHYAVESENKTAMNLIIKDKESLKITDQYGRTALHIAVINKKVDYAKKLLEARANKDTADIFKKTPLHYAVSNGDIEMIKLLKENYANFNSCCEDDKYKTTNIYPIHIAAEKGLEDVFNLLLSYDANIKSKDSRGATIFHYASRGNQSKFINNHKDLFKTLLDAKDSSNRTAVHYAAEGNAVDALKVLLELGAYADPQDEKDVTPLMIAAHHNFHEFAKVILQKGNFIITSDREKKNAIHYAAETGSIATLKVLLQKKKNNAINAKDKNSYTPLFAAYYHEQLEAFKLLVSKGADINEQGRKGRTILCEAVDDNKKEYVKIIMETNKVNKDIFDDPQFIDACNKCSAEIKNLIHVGEK